MRIAPFLTVALLLPLAACTDRMPPLQSVATTPAKPTTMPEPAYPRDVWCSQIGGETVLRVMVGADGKAGDIRVVSASPSPQLDEAAIAAVKNWTFDPATRDGQPVAEEVKVPVTFTAPTTKPAECAAAAPPAA